MKYEGAHRLGQEERKRQEKEIRRNDIITAAEKVFFSKGYEDATMDEVAQEAEFSKMLATIRRDAPIDFKLPAQEFRAGLDMKKLTALFTAALCCFLPFACFLLKDQLKKLLRGELLLHGQPQG